MLATLSSEELTAWQIYEEMEPFGERAEYLRAASLCALLFNVNRGAKSKPATPEDFMPDTFKTPAPPADPRDVFLALAHGIGGKRLKVVKRNG